jgi:glycosyltransferase involved in cell wall biosynthesis
MKILQVAPYFPPYQGGQERHVERLTSHLRERGHSVKVLTSDYPPEITTDDTGVVRLPVHKRVLRNPIVSPQQEKIVGLLEWADIAHTHNEHAFISNLVAMLSQRVNTRMVLTCHGQLSFGSPVSDIIEQAYNRTIGAATLRAMDKVIALSESDKEYLSSLGTPERNIDIIPNAIEQPDAPTASVVTEFEQREGIGERDVILFVGPIVKRKSPETLLRAMAHVRDTHPDALAMFVGKGEYREEIESKASSLGMEEHVRFTGFLPREELLAAYQSASVLAVPSISEGLPTTIMEGMMHKLPVVATNLGPIQDWFDQHALLVESDPDAFAGAIRLLLSHDQMAQQLGESGADLVRSRLTWDQVATEIMHSYKQLVEEPSYTAKSKA